MIDADELPEGWASCSVLDLCHAVRGVSYSKGEASRTPEKGLVPIVRANNIDGELTFEDLQFVPQARVSKDQRLRVGDVVIAMSSGSKSVVGKAASVTKPWTGAFGAFCGVLRPCSEIEARHFGLFFQTVAYRKTISDASAGTNINNLKREHFAAISFPIPPLAEQQRIVAKVEALLARVNAARQRLAKAPAILKRLRQSVLAAACSGRLIADWRSDTNGEALDAGWETRRLDSLFEIRTGGTPSRKNPAYFTNGTIPWVKTTEVQNCDIFDTAEKITEDALDNSSAKVFPPSTILVALYGEGRTRGQIARLRIPAATNQACAALVNPKMPDITNRWVFLALLAAYDDLRGESAGGNQPNLSNGLIRTWEIPLPPTSEQHEIVRRVEALFKLADALEKRVAAAMVRAEKLTQAILAKAFRGELVSTEAELARREGRAYEPASVLLERIKKSTDCTDSTDSKKRKKRR